MRSFLVNGLLRATLSVVGRGLGYGLVAQMPAGAVGIAFQEMRGDLRRTPLFLELLLDELPQLRLPRQHRTAWPPRSLSSPGMRQVAVVDTAVVWPQVAAQLSADRRGRAAEPAGDLAHPEPSLTQGGDPLSLEQAEVTTGTGRFGQTPGRESTILHPPSVAGLAADAEQLAGGDGADA